MNHIPDLLNIEATLSKEHSRAENALNYAFTTGESAGSLSLLLNHWDSSESSWNPEYFSDDLFINELISRTLMKKLSETDYAPNTKYLKHVLCTPPANLESTKMRQDVQRELQSDPETRNRFVRLLKQLIDLRNEFDSTSMLGPGYFSRRRIDMLRSIHNSVELAASSFADSNVALARISNWANEFKATDGYRTLLDFLDYDRNLSTVNLQVKVGADGRIRTFKIARIKENTNNSFYQSPVGRIFTRLQLFLRGYGISHDGLIARWVETVFAGIKSDLAHFIGLIGHMEFHMASLTFADLCRKHNMSCCIPEFTTAEHKPARVIDKAFNPLLLGVEKNIVPGRLAIEDDNTTLIVTGPNSGGKTRFLQTVAFIQLMAQAGMTVPAHHAVMKPVSGLFVTLAERTSADQKEGRLGTELLRIRRLFEQSKHNSMVVLDELCSGTNPSEGEEIFHLVLSLLNKVGCETFISTHFLRFAKQLQEEKETLNLHFLKVELDESHKPTYRFIEGVAPTSLAKHTASRLGVSKEDLLKLIEKK